MIRILVISMSLSLASPLSALAGITGPVTGHPLSIRLKIVHQTTNSSDDQKPEGQSRNEKDLFEACVGTPPTKTQGVFLFLDCADLSTNVIAAIDTTDPNTALTQVGTLEFDMDHEVTTTKTGVVTQQALPVQITLSCPLSSIDATAFGIMTLKFSELDMVDSCPVSGSVKIIGFGDDPDPLVLNNGSSISIGKRSDLIQNFPAF